jgi:hypothetical protein
MSNVQKHLAADLKSVQCGFESHRPYWRYAQKLWIEDLLKDVVYLPFE